MIRYKFVSNVLEANTIHYNNTNHYGGLVMELAFFRRKPQKAYRRQLRACTYCKYRSQKFMIWYVQTDYTALLWSSRHLQQQTFTAVYIYSFLVDFLLFLQTHLTILHRDILRALGSTQVRLEVPRKRR